MPADWPNLLHLAEKARAVEDLKRTDVISHAQHAELMAELREMSRPPIWFHCVMGDVAGTFPLASPDGVHVMLQFMGVRPAMVPDISGWASDVYSRGSIGEVAVFNHPAGKLAVISTAERIPGEE